MRWTRLEVPDEPWPLPNPLGVVPVVPLPNRPRLSGRSWSVTGVPVRLDGRREIAAVMSNQDAINKYRADALVASEFAAFRQRWAIGIDIPARPRDGPAHRALPPAVDRLWTFPRPDPEDPNQAFPQVGEFAATDLLPYKLMIETEVGHISSHQPHPLPLLPRPAAGHPAVGRVAEVVGGRPRAQGRAHRAPPGRGLGGGHAPLPAGHGRRRGEPSARPRPSGATPRPRTRPCARTPCSSSSRRASSTSSPRRSSWATRPSRCARCASAGRPRSPTSSAACRPLTRTTPIGAGFTAAATSTGA